MSSACAEALEALDFTPSCAMVEHLDVGAQQWFIGCGCRGAVDILPLCETCIEGLQSCAQAKDRCEHCGRTGLVSEIWRPLASAMSGQWSSSNRRAGLPRNWGATCRVVAERAGGRCELTHDGQRCIKVGTEVDHRDDPTDHRPEALQLLCHDHHNDKTQAEAQAARDAMWAKTKRPQPAHPGLISQM